MMNKLGIVAMFKNVLFEHNAHGKNSIILVKACEQYVHKPEQYVHKPDEAERAHILRVLNIIMKYFSKLMLIRLHVGDQHMLLRLPTIQNDVKCVKQAIAAVS